MNSKTDHPSKAKLDARTAPNTAPVRVVLPGPQEWQRRRPKPYAHPKAQAQRRLFLFAGVFGTLLVQFFAIYSLLRPVSDWVERPKPEPIELPDELVFDLLPPIPPPPVPPPPQSSKAQAGIRSGADTAPAEAQSAAAQTAPSTSAASQTPNRSANAVTAPTAATPASASEQREAPARVMRSASVPVAASSSLTPTPKIESFAQPNVSPAIVEAPVAEASNQEPSEEQAAESGNSEPAEALVTAARPMQIESPVVHREQAASPNFATAAPALPQLGAATLPQAAARPAPAPLQPQASLDLLKAEVEVEIDQQIAEPVLAAEAREVPIEPAQLERSAPEPVRIDVQPLAEVSAPTVPAPTAIAPERVLQKTAIDISQQRPELPNPAIRPEISNTPLDAQALQQAEAEALADEQAKALAAAAETQARETQAAETQAAETQAAETQAAETQATALAQSQAQAEVEAKASDRDPANASSAQTATPTEGSSKQGASKALSGEADPFARGNQALQSGDLLGQGLEAAGDIAAEDARNSQGRGNAFRRYHDPFADDRPNPLKGLRMREPQMFADLARFVLATFGRAALGAAVGANEEIDDRVGVDSGILIEQWLEQHHGDLKKECYKNQNGMNDRLRKLLCDQ